MTGTKKRVLFLCTGNSARSQMAEGFLRDAAGDVYEVLSAGTDPKGIHPRTLEVMAESDIDLREHTSKSLDAFMDQSFDLVITVCDRAREACPVLPGTMLLHWSFEDPAEAEGDAQLQVFREIRDEIKNQIQRFVASDQDPQIRKPV